MTNNIACEFELTWTLSEHAMPVFPESFIAHQVTLLSAKLGPGIRTIASSFFQTITARARTITPLGPYCPVSVHLK